MIAVVAAPAASDARNVAPGTGVPSAATNCPEIVIGPAGPSGNTIIAQVTGIAHPHPAPRDQAFGASMQQTAGSVAGDLSIAMSNALRLKQGVKVNQKLLDSAVGSGG